MSTVLHLTGPILTGPSDADVTSQAWVVDGHITFEAPPAATEMTTLAGYALPGLVDAHCHVGLGSHGAVDDETSLAQATQDRDSGALLLRDAGSPVDTSWITERDDMPDIIRSGRHIARTRRYIRNYAHEIEPPELADLMAAQARIGDGWVKIVGDWIDRDKGDLGFCWTPDSVKDGIAAAHAEGAKVTAHCFAEESLMPLVEAGIDCVEHATGLTESMLDAFASRGVAIVPTLVNIATFPDIAAPAETKYPAYHRHMLDLHARRYDTIGAAHEAGIQVFCGTDAGGSIAHGLVPDEVVELTKAGLSNTEALSAASWGAREWLGRPGIVEGAPADIVLYAEDPRQDVRVLADPAAIIIKGNHITRAS